MTAGPNSVAKGARSAASVPIVVSARPATQRSLPRWLDRADATDAMIVVAVTRNAMIRIDPQNPHRNSQRRSQHRSQRPSLWLGRLQRRANPAATRATSGANAANARIDPSVANGKIARAASAASALRTRRV